MPVRGIVLRKLSFQYCRSVKSVTIEPDLKVFLCIVLRFNFVDFHVHPIGLRDLNSKITKKFLSFRGNITDDTVQMLKMEEKAYKLPQNCFCRVTH